VDEIVDNRQFPVEEMWITRELSTGPSYPQNYPQVYPQILPLLSTGLSTAFMILKQYKAIIHGLANIFIHKRRCLSTGSVDKSKNLWTKDQELSTSSPEPVDSLWITFDRYAYQSVTRCCEILPLWRRGK
jgi:hypothetical protein